MQLPKKILEDQNMDRLIYFEKFSVSLLTNAATYYIIDILKVETLHIVPPTGKGVNCSNSILTDFSRAGTAAEACFCLVFYIFRAIIKTLKHNPKEVLSMINILKNEYGVTEFAIKSWKNYSLYVLHTIALDGLYGVGIYLLLCFLMLIL